MKPIVTTLTALAVVLAASTGAQAGKMPMVNFKPKPPSVQIRPTRILPHLPAGMASRLMKEKEQPAEAADGVPQPEPPIRPRTAKVIPVVTFTLAPLPRSKPPIPAAVIDPDDLMTIPPDLRDINSEDLQKLKDFQDFATNGPNNAAPDVFGPREEGQPGDEPGYGGPINPSDHAANQAEANQEGRDKQLDDFRAIAGFDPANPGGGDTRRERDFHTPANNPGAAGGAINDPRGMASGGRVIWSGGNQRGDTYHHYTQYEDFSETTTQYTPNPPDAPEVAAETVRETRNSDGSSQRTTNRRFKDWASDVYDEYKDSRGQVQATRYRYYNDEGELVIDRTDVPTDPDDQPGAEGSGPGGADNCGWNPMSGCTKKSTPIWKAAVQPGAHQDAGGGSAGPSLGQEAVTNSGDGTFDSGASGGGGGAGQPDPCRMAGGCGGPIGEAGSGPGPAN